MGKTWYYRMLLSYLPIFFLVTFLLLFLYFFSLSDRNEKQTIASNKLLGLEVMQLVESDLQSINVMFARESLYSKDLRNFFNDATNEFIRYQAYLQIQEYMASNSLIESIYLINFKQQSVLGNSKPYSLSDFQQLAYLDQRQLENYSSLWSRVYTQLKTSEDMDQDTKSPRIISIVKKLGAVDSDGIVLVNVDVGLLQDRINQAYDPELIRIIALHDGDSVILDNSSDGMPIEKVVELKSPITGWTFHIGYDHGWLFGSSSFISNMGLVLAVLAVILGALTIVLVTQRQYRPIKQIMSRVFHGSMDGAATNEKGANELTRIAAALDKYMDHSHKYHTLYLSEYELRNRLEIREMIEGNRGHSTAAWEELRNRLKLPDQPHYRQCLLLEIDDFRGFSVNYSAKDQELLRFVIFNVVSELSKLREVTLYSDWISGERLAVVLYLTKPQLQGSQLVNELIHAILDWVDRHLPFTITIGLGTPVMEDKRISESYQEAKSSLSYKIVLGKNRSLAYEELSINPMKELGERISQISQLVRSLLQGKPEWESLLLDLLETMKRSLLSRDDIMNLLHYMIYQIQKELALQNDSMSDYWKNEVMPHLEAKLQAEEMLDELSLHLLAFIRPLYDKIAISQRSTKHYDLMQQVRYYIEEHYCDDALSLESLSHHFGIGDKYLSKLFKETCGINFVDFVTELRMNKAKQLLLDTSQSIYEVGQQVGYPNPLTFTRVFKRTFKMTPSELRQSSSA